MNDATVVVNTAEDVVVSGNYVSPDLDTVLYTLAGLIDSKHWFGIEGDTYHTHRQIKNFSSEIFSGSEPDESISSDERTLDDWRTFSGSEEFMKIGDRDRATHIIRTGFMNEGLSLTQATERLADSFQLDASVLPMTDDVAVTLVRTDLGVMHFQEFWILHGGEPAVESIECKLGEGAGPTDRVSESLDDPVIIGPSNPVSSIKPILSLSGVENLLREVPVVLISPFVNDRVFSGPAGKFMEAQGYNSSTRGVLNYYGSLVDGFVLDSKDRTDTNRPTLRTNTDLSRPDQRSRLASEVLDFLDTNIL